MTIHDATEQAYKNGYKQGATDFAKLIKKDFENPHIQKSGLDFVDFLKGVVDNRLKKMVGEDK